jgi:hypothetical protein
MATIEVQQYFCAVLAEMMNGLALYPAADEFVITHSHHPDVPLPVTPIKQPQTLFLEPLSILVHLFLDMFCLFKLCLEFDPLLSGLALSLAIPGIIVMQRFQRGRQMFPDVLGQISKSAKYNS